MRILFQGDSITDAGRDRNDYHNLAGYSQLTANKLNNRFNNLEFINLGVSGDRTIDLINRYDTDFKDINPDIITILIGVNDLWRRFDANSYTNPVQFEKNYRQILTGIKKDTKAKIIIMEPFILPVEDKMHFRLDLPPLIEVSRKVAVDFANAYIPLDGIFAKECLNYKAEELAADGIHPTPLGNEIISKYLSEEIQKFI
jgi:lysophospholipase L1-like esterase